MNCLAYCVTNLLVSFSVALKWDKKADKKIIDFPNNWKSITEENFTQYHDSDKNGFAIRTGSINQIVVIDADESKANAAGTPIPQEILSILEENAEPIVKTPNGRHFYFGTAAIIKSSTDIRWNGTKIPYLDIRAEGGIILAPPSVYVKNETACRYSFIKGDLSEMNELPEEILKAIQTAPTSEQFIQEFKESTPSEVAEDLLKAIASARWDSRSDWLTIGIILFNENLPLSLWDSYSKTSPRYTADGCLKAWRSFHKGNLTMRSLWKMVKEDNVIEYNKLQRKHINIKSFLEPTHLSLARLFHTLRPDDYMYAPGYGWYERLQNNVWKCRTEDPPGQVLAIADCLIPLVNDYLNDAMDNASTAADQKDRDIHAEFAKTCTKIRTNLSHNGFLTSIQKLLIGLYSNDSFIQTLDSNPNLFAFENGVFDLDVNEFRPIRPEDNISFTCGHHYNEKSSADTRKEILDWFSSIFENNQMRDYFLKKIAYNLHGKHRFQELDFWKGRGSNGKSQIIRLIENTFGDYCKTIPTSYFTDDVKGKDTPLPALVQCRGARLVWASEPEAGSQLQTGFIKRISGSDAISVRDMYKSNVSFTPQFGVILLLNDYPKIPKTTEFSALQRRFRVIPFPYQFLDNPMAENHKMIDRRYIDLVTSDRWRSEFMLLLLDIYNRDIVTATALEQPKEVKEATNGFFEENNPIAVWLYKRFDTLATNECYVSASEMTTMFNQENKEKFTAARFGSFMSALGFHSKKNGGIMIYRGMKLKEEYIEGGP